MSRRPKKKELAGNAVKSSGKSPSATSRTPFAAGSRTLGSAESPAGLSERRLVLGICIFLAAIVWLVFGQTVHFAFVNYDDNFYVYENPAVMGGLSLDGVKWAFTHTVAFNWHPLTMLSHMLDWQLYGSNAGGHHLTNVLLHTATVILLFFALRQMTGNLWRSALVAAVFAIHPLRAESVAWVAERKDVLSGLFFMLTLWAYARYARRPFSIGRYLCVVVLFALGLFSKPMLVTLPFVLLLLDYWPLERFQWTTFRDTLRTLRPLVWEKIPLFLIATVLGVVTLVAQNNSRTALEAMPAAIRFSNVLVSYGIYVWEMVWPRHLAAFYPFLSVTPVWPIVGGGALLLVATLLAIWAARRRAYFLVGWFWYVVMLAPVIGIVQVGLQSHADRYTYLPQIGLYLLLTWGLAELSASWRYRRVVLAGVSATILVVLIFCARAQVSCWQNSEALWTHALACTADNDTARVNFGAVLLHAGRRDEAVAQFQQALQLNPRSYEAYNDLGYILNQKRQYQEAMVQFQRALQINPGSAEAHFNLGMALLHTGRRDEAKVQFQQALQINPSYEVARNNLGYVLIQMGQYQEAVVQFQRALQINPGSAEAHFNLGMALLQMGRWDEAMAQFQQVLQINPRSVEACNNLGYVFLQTGRYPEAMVQFQQALQINPRSAEAHDNLGTVLLRAGRPDEAVAQFQQALQINPDFAGAQFDLGDVLLRLGRADEAMVHYQRALQINPNSVKILNGLAWVLATASPEAVRDGRQAVALAEKANQIAGVEDPSLLRTLAAAYAEAGRFDDAVRSVQRAMALAQAAGQSNLVTQLDSQLKLYTAKRPFHQDGGRFEY
jgi:tetratricopeptide (TPR) repeat protein